MEKYLNSDDPFEDPSAKEFDIESQLETDTARASIPIATPNFQSSFARSLSFTNNQTQSLDSFELNFRIGAEAADRHISVLQGLLPDQKDATAFAYSSLHNFQTNAPPVSTSPIPPPLPSSSPPTFHNVSVELSSGTSSTTGAQDQPDTATIPSTPPKPRGVRMYLPSSTPKRRYMTISSIKSHTVS